MSTADQGLACLSPQAYAYAPRPLQIQQVSGDMRVGQEERFRVTPELRAYAFLSTVGLVLGAYHGYKRNDSVGWAVGWALLGGMFPYITIPISLAQGFGERK